MTRTSFNSLVLVLCIAASAGAQDRPAERTFEFRNLELRSVLDSLLRWYAVPLVFLENDVAEKRVTANCSSCDLEEALSAVLSGQELRATRIADQIVIRSHTADQGSAGVTYAGMLLDSLTGEPVSGASVLLTPLLDTAPYRWCSTGASGFFSLRHVQPGEYELHVRRVGYQTLSERVSIGAHATGVREIPLRTRELVQPHVTVEGQRSAFAAARGISRGVFIRSTPSDHHQYYLEGARVYNPVHFGGLTSAFYGDALHDVQAVAGGVPPYYGGRIGGVLDVALRRGSKEALDGSIEMGTLGTGMALEGPAADLTTFVLSGRQGYPDVLSRVSYPDKPASDLHTSELMFKLTHALSGRQQISLTGFYGGDAHEKNVSGGSGLQLFNALRWKNAAASVRWNGVADPSLLFSASAALTDYRFTAGHQLSPVGSSASSFDSRASLQDLSLRAHAEYFYDEFHTVLAGVELVRHSLSGSISPFSSQLVSTSLDGPSPWELSVYFQDQWRLVPSVLAELGARATSFVAGGGASSSIDPRFSLLVLIDEDRRISGSLSAVTQYLHPYRHSGIFLYYPSIFFYPSEGSVPPSTSLHAALGFENAFQEDRYRLSVESYFRVTRNLHEFGADTSQPSATALTDLLLVGEGTSYGADVTFAKRTGDVTGTFRYGLSWSVNRFSEWNDGEPFRPRFDRRHEIYAAVTYAVTDEWALGGMCLLSSNQFPPLGTEGIAKTAVDRTNGPLMGEFSRYTEPFDLNGGRLPGFQRIELRASYSFDMMGKSWEGTFRLLNGYGLFDPFRWQLTGNVDPRLQWRIFFDAPPLFPLYPSLSLRMTL